MSRRHCRIEPAGAGWRIVDNGSKNGTRIHWTKVAEQPLLDGDTVRIGRTIMTFHAGAFEPPAVQPNPNRIVRPSDPSEALHGTVSGFVLTDEDVDDAPTHAEEAGQSDDQSLHLIRQAVEQETGWRPSSGGEMSWQPTAPEAGNPRRPMPTPRPYATSGMPRRPLGIPMTDLSLQADPRMVRPPRRRWGRAAFALCLTLILVPAGTAALAATGFLLARVLLG